GRRYALGPARRHPRARRLQWRRKGRLRDLPAVHGPVVPLRDRRLHDGHEPRHTGDRPAVAGPSAPRILRIIARLTVGGPARHVVLVDRGLRARGYDTLLVHGSVGP